MKLSMLNCNGPTVDGANRIRSVTAAVKAIVEASGRRTAGPRAMPSSTYHMYSTLSVQRTNRAPIPPNVGPSPTASARACQL